MIVRRSFLAGIAALSAAPFVNGAELPDLKGRTLVVATENAYPPLQFVDPRSGATVGWEYDAMNEIGRRLNARIEYRNISWDVMMQAVADGHYDVGMTGISITDERKAKVDFSGPYMRSEMFMLVRGDETRFTDAGSFAALEKGIVGAQAGTTSFYTAVYNILDGNEKNPRIRLMETFATSVAALKSGDVDLVLTDSVAGNGYVQASGGKLKLIGEPFGGDEFGFIFKKGSDLVAPIDRLVATLKADGTFAALDRKWFFEYQLGQ